MATTKKITKAQRNSDIIALLKGEAVTFGTTIEDAIAHLTHENELLAKKNSGDSKKPTKAQAENEVFKTAIMAWLATQTEGRTATEVMNACNLASNQKTAALLRSLKNEGKVDKVVVKGKPLFSICETVDEDTTEDEGEGV